jgi:sialidase-1
MLNIRNESPKHRRLTSISKDGISNWSLPEFDEALFDPICMASIVRVQDQLVWANPAGDGNSKARTNLTLRLSTDSGKTWPAQKLLEPGIAAYSDLAATADGTVFCFYECGGVNDQQFYTRSLRLAKFDTGWIGDAKAPSAR